MEFGFRRRARGIDFCFSKTMDSIWVRHFEFYLSLDGAANVTKQSTDHSEQLLFVELLLSLLLLLLLFDK